MQPPVVAVAVAVAGLRATVGQATLVARYTSTALGLLVLMAALELARPQLTLQQAQAATARLAAHLATVVGVVGVVARRTPLRVPLVLVDKAGQVARLVAVAVAVAVLAAHRAVRATVGQALAGK